MNPLKPAAISPGDTIGIVAPAGIVDRAKLRLASERLEAKGFKIRTYRDLFARRGYLAGSDAERAAELNEAFADPGCAAIFPARGGYGCLRMVDQVDFDLVRANPKVFLGFSDNTVLHSALWHEAQLVTFHGPHPSDSYGRPDGPTELTEKWLWDCVSGKSSGNSQTIVSANEPAAFSSSVSHMARGRLVGGNLALVCSLLSTPYEIATEDCILFLEDTDEPPYRIDRFLAQLKLAGHLDRVNGLILGQFSNCHIPSDDASLTLEEVLVDHLGGLDCPILSGFPSGHGHDNVTFPLGVEVEINTVRRQLEIRESAVR